MSQLREAARRIAFFGGSFDPPHLGHLAVAGAARAALALDTVLFAPVAAQPLKPQGSSAAFDDRAEMTRLAIADEPGFSLSLADAPTVTRAPNYTIDTLLGLRAQLQGKGHLYCLMGADSLLGLRHWHRAAEIPFVAPLIVASRPNQQLDDLAEALPAGLALKAEPDPEIHGSAVEVRCYRLSNGAQESAPFYLLPGLHVEISATDIRERIRAGAADDLLPPAVATYIHSHGLYL